jgi:NTE family protein
MTRALNSSALRPRVGLALSGGAARGAAHVGVLKVLLANNVPVDCVAGTSAGALVGAAFAAGLPVEELERIALRMRWRDFGRVTLSRLGVQSNARLAEYVRERFPFTRIEELPIPFAAVATDLDTGRAVVLKGEGDIGLAVRASCAVPGWYVPVVDGEGRQLVDGGVVSLVPVSAARSLGAEVVIAVDVNHEGATFLGASRTALGVIIQSLVHSQRSASAHEVRQADVAILPRVGHIRWDEMRRGAELVAAGEEAAREALPQIGRLLAAREEESRALT